MAGGIGRAASGRHQFGIDPAPAMDERAQTANEHPDEATGPHWAAMLRALRNACGVSQHGWAARLGVGRATIQRWERGEVIPDALAEAALLAECERSGLYRRVARGPLLGAPRTPEDLRDLLAHARLGRASSPSAPGAPEGRAPGAEPAARLPVPLTSLIGRAQEVAAVAALLMRRRLVTLTGPGGVGKTRLALQVAADLQGDFVDGAAFIPLGGVQDAALVPHAIAQALALPSVAGGSPHDGLLLFLRERHQFLVLDNFEHLLDAAPLIPTLLAACPSLAILVTSRAVLRVSAEQEFPVRPLATPESAMPNAEQILRSPAVALFVEQARRARPDFALTSENAPAVAAVCRRVDGLPLALELAAARTRTFTPAELLPRLERRLPLLTSGTRDLPARQQTLRDTIAWSYQLLTPDEQVLFRRLTVFAGGWTLAAAEAVCGDESSVDVLEGLNSLIEKSLVHREEGAGPSASSGQTDETRFGMLETIREFGLEVLVAAGEEETIRHRHAVHFLSAIESARLRSLQVAPEPWRRWLTVEQNNLRAALGWAVACGDAELGLRLVTALAGWYETEAWDEGCRWAEAVLALPGVAESPAAWARALHAAGLLAAMVGDVGTARLRLEQSVALWRELDDPWWLGWTLHSLGRVLRANLPAARATGEEAVRLLRTTGDRWALAMALSSLGGTLAMMDEPDALASADAVLEENCALFAEVGGGGQEGLPLQQLGRLARRRGDYQTARRRFEESKAAFAAVRGPGLPLVMGELGWLAYEEGDLAEARRHFGESLAAAQKVGDTPLAAVALWGLAGVVARRGASSVAARLLGAADTALAGRELPAFGIQAPHQAIVDRTRAALGETAFHAAWTAGQALSLDEVITYANEVAATPGEPPVHTATADPDLPGGLSAREVEVLALLAEGCSNREIAAALVLSVRTVEHHLARIYAKIHARGRTDAAAYAVRHGLIQSGTQ